MMNHGIYRKGLVFAIIFLLIGVSLTNSASGIDILKISKNDIESTHDNSSNIPSFIDYEEIFANKEKIRIKLNNTLKTIYLFMLLKSWRRRSELFQKITTKPPDDNESEYFSYWAKPVFQIGLPYQHFATMITPEGHLYTGSAELEFFAGKNLKQINQRIWTLYKGYLPCINYQIVKDDLIFKIQAFQYWLDEKYNSPPVNFIKVQVINPTQTIKETKFALGFKYGGIDHRPFEMVNFDPFKFSWKYEMNDYFAARNNSLIYLWDKSPTEKLQNQRKSYQNTFSCINWQKTVCLSSYDVKLESNEIKNYTFKMPQYPIYTSNQTALTLLENAQYEDYFEKMQVFWDGLIEQGATINVPEDKVINASKSYLIQSFMCQNNISENELAQVFNRFHFNVFAVSFADCMGSMYCFYNYFDMAQKLIRHTANTQDDSGNMFTHPGYWKQIGEALAGFGEYIKLTNDTDIAVEILPNVTRAVGWIKNGTLEDRFGLIPFADTTDGPYLVGHYTGHNFCALMGLDGAITVAKAAGSKLLAEDFQRFHDAYRNHFFKQLNISSARNNGVIPPGMDVIGGKHWNNLLAAYRDNLLDPYDPLVNTTFKHYRECYMKEGMSIDCKAIHGWHTEVIARTALRRGEQENVLNDFYSMLLHTGSCHEGFEGSVFTSTRDYTAFASLPVRLVIRNIGPYYINFPNNARFSASINNLLRRMLIRESQNKLHLFSAISPEWVKPGDKIEVLNAPTYFGMVNLSAISTDNGINISFEPNWRELPDSVILHMPFFAEIKSVVINDMIISANQDYIELPIGNCKVNISWIIDPTVDLSYDKLVEDYIAGKI
ncbi:MAG: hypothetical protein KAW45_05425 [Thermoplasmatales archaeon]|nr:hypothetical protein [Thermoplasmatales archaeon]